ncbi:MAG: class I SAM-dependent methyltransferase [Firmicutes bacterium]|nr:class I SAM-dependent methyltransferase [Bacillota bacterium]
MDREDRWDQFIIERREMELQNLNKVSSLVVEFADLLEKKGVDLVLDLGCGVGRHLHYLARRGFKVIGFDISEETLNIAEDLANEAGIEADFVQGDYLDLPFNNEVIPAIISTSALHHDFPENIAKTFREIKRIMSGGGYLACDLLSTRDSWFGLGRALGEKLFLNHRIPHYFFDEDELLSIMKKINFNVIKLDRDNIVEVRGGNEFRREKFHLIARKILSQYSPYPSNSGRILT